MVCPNCGEPCERDTVDNGVCEQPVGPWGCFQCGWFEGMDGPVIDDPMPPLVDREPLTEDPRIPHGSMTRERDVQVERPVNAFTCDEDNRPRRDDEGF